MKRITIAAALGFISASTLAGGLASNNNQNPIFFRQPAQHAVVGIQGAYYDPAGVALMEEGWHFAIGNQLAYQKREITSTYAPFAMNVNNGASAERVFKGKTFSPCIPSLDLAYVNSKWAASFHFGVVSGGGNCKFDDGLGSFEAPMALLPGALNTLIGSPAFNGYDADIRFKGSSAAFGAQFNFAYKVIDTPDQKLSVSAGVRLNYVQNAYEGGIFDYTLYQGGTPVPAVNALTSVLSTKLPAAQASAFAAQLAGDKEVDCVQKAFAVNPVVGIHYAVGAWDFAAKYEFVTKVELKNETGINTAGIAQFGDGLKSNSDIPALLAGGFNVDILPGLHAAAGINVYLDKSADYGGKQDKLGKNTLEYNAGIEYDINTRWTVSLGTQITRFDFGENNDYLTDMAFSLPSWCLGGGFRYHINDRLAIDVSAFNTFYSKESKKYVDYGNAGATYKNALSAVPGIPAPVLDALAVPGADEFYRTSLSGGIGLIWDF